jgi:hypothetical protein
MVLPFVDQVAVAFPGPANPHTYLERNIGIEYGEMVVKASLMGGILLTMETFTRNLNPKNLRALPNWKLSCAINRQGSGAFHLIRMSG